MSEFTENYRERVKTLTAYMMGLIDGGSRTELLAEYRIRETTFMPRDVLYLFDEIYKKKIATDEIKIASNRLFNILYEDLSGYVKYDYPQNSMLWYLIRDNEGARKHLAGTKAHVKLINKEQNPGIISNLIEAFERLEDFTVHYTVKENILFPEIEKAWEHYQCLKLMWTFHDEIRRNIKKTIEILKEPAFDLKLFNKFCGMVYFNINTIIFREENVLFPVMFETMSSDVFQRMTAQLPDFNMAFVRVDPAAGGVREEVMMNSEERVKFSTGEMSLGQIEMIFNHLPVDITFVDQDDRVRYFSNPKERLFPRTAGIIGRTVMDCHPHESAEVVGRIVESFRTGDKDEASFHLHLGSKYILIKYFAVRNTDGAYRGVLEVSQEISEIQSIKGERRLLDW